MSQRLSARKPGAAPERDPECRPQRHREAKRGGDPRQGRAKMKEHVALAQLARDEGQHLERGRQDLGRGKRGARLPDGDDGKRRGYTRPHPNRAIVPQPSWPMSA